MKSILLIIVPILFLSCSMIKKMGVKAPVKGQEILVSKWAKNVESDYESGNLPVSLSGSNAKDGIVYIGKSDGEFSALDLANGRELWSNAKGNGFHSEPSFYEDQVLVGNIDGRFFSFNRFSGKLKYEIDLGSAIEAMPVVSKGRVLLHLRNHKLIVLDSSTGKILWTYQRAIPYKTTLQRTSKPTVVENTIYVGFADGFIVSLNLLDGKVLWEKKLSTSSKFVDVDISPFVEGEKLYIGSLAGQFSILNKRDGKVLRRFSFSASREPFVYKKQKFVGTVNGRVVVLDEFDNFIRDYKIGDYSISNILSWKEGILVSTTGGKLYHLKDSELNKNLFKEVFDFGSIGSSVFSKMQVEANNLIVFSSRNRLYVFN